MQSGVVFKGDSRGVLIPGGLSSLPPRSRCQRLNRLTTRAESKTSPKLEQVVKKIDTVLEDIDDNVLQYCSLDAKGGKPKSKLTLGQKEQEFLDALRSFYYEDKPRLSNEEFDNLKEELLWEGSKVAILSSTEQKFMEASLAYQAGKPILSDTEFDELKGQLRKKNSKVVSQGPRCSIRSRNMYSDADPDYLKMTILNLPAALITLGALFSVDDLTGFEITKFLELPQPYGIAVVWGLVLPAIYVLSTSLTNIVLKDGLILKGNCPNCNTPASTYFGDILTITGNREKNEIVCSNCKAKLTFNATKGQISVNQFPDEKKPEKKADNKKPPPKKDEKKETAKASA